MKKLTELIRLANQFEQLATFSMHKGVKPNLIRSIIDASGIKAVLFNSTDEAGRSEGWFVRVDGTIEDAKKLMDAIQNSEHLVHNLNSNQIGDDHEFRVTGRKMTTEEEEQYKKIMRW